MTHREAELLLHALRNAPNTQQESDDEEGIYRELEFKGFVEDEDGWWFTTDEGRAALIEYIEGE